MSPVLIPLIISAVGAIAGAIKNRQSQTTTDTHTLDPAYGGLRDQLVSMIGSRLNTGSDTDRLTAQNTGDINNTYAGADTALSNSLAARGLGRSPIAGRAAGILQGGRASEITRMKQGMPLLQEQMQTSRLAQALQMMNLGYGYSTGAQTTTGTSGGGAAGSSNGLGAMLGWMYGQGAFNRPSAPPAANPDVLPSQMWGVS